MSAMLTDRQQIDKVPKGSVVFISSPPKLINAVYGGLMSNRAQYSGAVGTVVDGRIRDLQEHRELGYPVYIPPPARSLLAQCHVNLAANADNAHRSSPAT